MYVCLFYNSEHTFESTFCTLQFQAWFPFIIEKFSHKYLPIYPFAHTVQNFMQYVYSGGSLEGLPSLHQYFRIGFI